MNNSFPRIIIFVLFAFVILGCATTQVAEENEELKVKPLYVGVTPNYPPVIFKQAGKIVGIEADFARLLAEVQQFPNTADAYFWSNINAQIIPPTISLCYKRNKAGKAGGLSPSWVIESLV